MQSRKLTTKASGVIEVTVVTEYQRPEEIRRWCEHVRAELERARRVVAQMELELKELDAACALLDSQGI